MTNVSGHGNGAQGFARRTPRRAASNGDLWTALPESTGFIGLQAFRLKTCWACHSRPRWASLTLPPFVGESAYSAVGLPWPSERQRAVQWSFQPNAHWHVFRHSRHSRASPPRSAAMCLCPLQTRFRQMVGC